jgi:hypothetical protein
VFCYASEKGAAFIDRALYLQHEWAEDAARRTFEAGVPARWVVADTATGRFGACENDWENGEAGTCWRCRGLGASTKVARGKREQWRGAYR